PWSGGGDGQGLPARCPFRLRLRGGRRRARYPGLPDHRVPFCLCRPSGLRTPAAGGKPFCGAGKRRPPRPVRAAGTGEHGLYAASHSNQGNDVALPLLWWLFPAGAGPLHGHGARAHSPPQQPGERRAMTAISQRKPLVMLAAGGTGGHLFPAQATARALLQRGFQVVLVTDRRGADFGHDLSQIEVRRIAAASPNRGRGLAKLGAAFELGLGYLQSSRMISQLRPEAVLGFGGYPSVPPLLAASRRKVPVLLHEQNQVAGRANRLLASRADIIATSFPVVAGLRAQSQDRLVFTGNPVRAEIAAVGQGPYPRI